MSKQILRRIAYRSSHVLYLPVSMQNLYSMGSKFIHLFRTPLRNQNYSYSFAFFACLQMKSEFITRLVSQKISTGQSCGGGYISEKQVSSLYK